MTLRGLLVLGLLAAPFAPPAARAASIVLDGSAILRQSPVEIEASLGVPVRSRPVSPGDFLLPGGGTSRIYRRAGVQIDIDFERERSTMVTVGFPDASIAPRTYDEALEVVNLPIGLRPDLVTRDARDWRDLRGYYVRVIAAYPALDRIETIIVSVHPLP
jgi:hypothetical protein